MPPMNNHGNYVLSLGNLCRWLGEHAENLGVEIFPGFPASTIVYEDDKVVGIQTGDMGVAMDGSEKSGFEPGIEIRAKHTIFAEGCRGHLGKELISRFSRLGGWGGRRSSRAPVGGSAGGLGRKSRTSWCKRHLWVWCPWHHHDRLLRVYH